MTGNKLEYGAVNGPVLAAIPPTARRVLDVGCGTGAFATALVARQPAEVVGLTYSEAEADQARTRLTAVHVVDLNAFDLKALGSSFDCIVCSHVLEHLYWPDQFLRAARPLLAPGGILVVGLPNLLIWRNRLRLAVGRFRYTDGGIMDRTHFRFFDWRTARELVTTAGYELTSAEADGGFPLSRFLPFVGRPLDRLALSCFPGLFGWQFVITARSAGE